MRDNFTKSMKDGCKAKGTKDREGIILSVFLNILNYDVKV